MRNPALKAELAAGLPATAGLALVLAAPVSENAWPVAAAVLAYALLSTILVISLASRRSLGWPNRITLLRAMITCALGGALVRPSLFLQQGSLIVALALIALALDGVDGWLARRLGETSDFGARFDMETDAALILVLCAGLWLSGLAPAWVLAIGLMRPAFIAAGLACPWLSKPLPESFRRKLVCVLQVGVLPIALLPVIAGPLRLALLAAALLALTASFAIDIAWLFRLRRACNQPQWRTP